MGIYAIKPKFKEALKPSLNFFVRFHPDTLSWLALLLCIIAAALFIFARQFNFLWPVISLLLMLRITLNALDGMVAQVKGIARKQGEILNEMLDRYSDTAVILGLIFSSIVKPWLGYLALISVLLSSFSGILGKAVYGKREFSGPMGKADRMIWLSAVCLLYFLFPFVRALSFTKFKFSLFELLMGMFIAGGQLNVIVRIKNMVKA